MFMRKDLPLLPSRMRDIGVDLRLIPRDCSSTRVSVNRRGRSLFRHSYRRSCVCSTNMSISCTTATARWYDSDSSHKCCVSSYMVTLVRVCSSARQLRKASDSADLYHTHAASHMDTWLCRQCQQGCQCRDSMSAIASQQQRCLKVVLLSVLQL